MKGLGESIHIWLTIFCVHASLITPGQFARVTLSSSGIWNNKIRILQVNNSKVYTFIPVHQIPSDRLRHPRASCNLIILFSLSCGSIHGNGTQADTTVQLWSLKGTIISDPLFRPSKIIRDKLCLNLWLRRFWTGFVKEEICATCGFLGNTDTELDRFSLRRPRPENVRRNAIRGPHPFRFQGWSFPRQ